MSAPSLTLSAPTAAHPEGTVLTYNSNTQIVPAQAEVNHPFSITVDEAGTKTTYTGTRVDQPAVPELIKPLTLTDSDTTVNWGTPKVTRTGTYQTTVWTRA